MQRRHYFGLALHSGYAVPPCLKVLTRYLPVRDHFTVALCLGEGMNRSDEPIPLDMKKEPKENMKLVLTEITSRGGISAGKRMGYVNNFTKLIQGTPVGANFGFSLDEIIICLRVAIFSRYKEVRAAAVRALRYLFTDELSFTKMMKLRIDIFVVRCLDKQQLSEVERVQALRFVRKVVAVCPHLFPMSFAHCLVAIAADKSQEQDRLGRACLATMCELAVTNVKVASYCGGINTIISSVLDSQVHRMNECLILTLLFLVNNPTTRCYVRSDVGLEGILAPFTDLHYNHSIEAADSSREDRESRLQASKMAIATIFKTWPGIISLCKPDGSGLQSLLQIFCLPDPLIKRHIMDILMDVFRVPVPEWTDDFVVALKSIDPRQMQDSWKLCEGFVAKEAQSLLPYRANTRVDLLRNYTAIVLTAFVSAGLFESLVQVITTSEDFVSVRATIVLGELLHMANTLLPPECSSHTHCLPTLMNIATSFQVTRQERGRASSAVNCLDRLHQLKKATLSSYSLFLEFLTMQSESSDSKTKHKKREREKDKLIKHVNKDVDDDMIREINAGFPGELLALQWDAIAAILESPSITLRKFEETGCSGFINNLLQFYKPSSQQFCTIELKNPMAKKLSEIGILMIDFLLANLQESQRMLEELVEEFSDCLEQAYTDVTKGVFSDENLIRTASRNYFVFLGRLSCSSAGHKLLGTIGVYQHYLDLASMKSRDRLLKLILASLDYRSAEISRIILSKILTAGSLSVRLYATKFLRALLRAKVAFFNNWGIEMLVTQLYDPDRSVAMEAADVLEEACEDEANLQYLVQLRPALLHLGEKGWRLLTRFLSVDKGFTYLNGLGYVGPLMEQWHQKYCDEYVKWVEEALAEALTTYQKPTDEDGGYVRQSAVKIVKRNVYVPTHFFGEIVKLKSGYEHLRQTGYVGQFVYTVQIFDSDNEKEIHKVKSALWALGHIGTSSWGLSILTEEDIIPQIVQMASFCRVLTIRGTCFYVLGLIATTRQGADILKSLNWESVRHKGEDSWPVVEVKEEALPYSKWFVSSLSAATDYYRQSVDESVRHKRSESEPEETQTKSIYDKDSGVYLGTKYRQSNIYDKNSGIYIGEEMPKVPKYDEGTGSGILLRMIEEKQQEASHVEDRRASGVSLAEEKSNSSEEQKKKVETPSLLERIKKAPMPTHLMPSGNESSSKKASSDDGPGRSKKVRPSARRNSSPRMVSRSEYSNASTRLLGENDSTVSSNQSIDLSSIKSSLGEDSLISRIVKSSSVTQIKDKMEEKHNNEDANLSPLSSTPRSRVTTDGVEIRHMRSSSGVSDSSCRSISSMDTSQSFGSYKSQTSLDENNTGLHLELDKNYEKSFRKRQAELNRIRSSSLNEKVTLVDPRLSISADARSASFSGTLPDDMAHYPVRANRQIYRSDCLISSPTDRRRMIGSNTEVMLLDNRTLVFKNLTRAEENGGFDESYWDQMSVSDGITDVASVVSRNDHVRDMGISVDDPSRKFPRKGYSRSVSSGGFSVTPRGKRMKKSVTSMSIWSLQSTPMSPTSPADMDTDLTQTFTSFRDAYGYSALSNIRRQRSISRDMESRIGGFNQSFTIVGPPIPESRPLSLDLAESQTSGGSMNLPTPSPLDHPYGGTLKAVTSARGNEFLGLTLPNDLHDFFMVEEYKFEGSWADNFTSSTSLPKDMDTSGDVKVKSMAHDATRCLYCMDVSRVTGKPVARRTSSGTNDKNGQKKETSAVYATVESFKKSVDPPSSGNILEKFLKGKRSDAITPKEIGLIKKEILKLVVNLSSAVTSKAHQQSLRSWKENMPQLFEDLCLYSQVIEQMSLYNYKLNMRRFIQGFFETVKFAQLIDQAEAVIKKQNTRNTSET